MDYAHFQSEGKELMRLTLVGLQESTHVDLGNHYFLFLEFQEDGFLRVLFFTKTIRSLRED